MEQLTLAGLIVLIVGTALKELFSYLKQRSLIGQEGRLAALEKASIEQKTSIESLKTTLVEPIKQLAEMYEWHDKSDEDGVKIWYIRKSLENVLRENAQATAVLAKNSELQTSLLRELIESQKSIMREQINQANELKMQQRRND